MRNHFQELRWQMRLKISAVAAAAAFAVIVLSARTVPAGVVITEIRTSGSAKAPHAEQITFLVQGKKEKIVLDNESIITDLEAKTFTWLYPTAKLLNTLPFPGDPPTRATVAGLALDTDYRKTGNTRTVAGYSCEEYLATETTPYTVTTVSSCFATSFPGSDAFSAFRQDLLGKLRSASAKISSSFPDGLLMTQEVTVRLDEDGVKKLPPATVRRLRKQTMRATAHASKIEVKSIELKELPDNTFEIPAGYSINNEMMREVPPAQQAAP